MANLRPTFALSIGSFRSTSERPVGGPTAFRVDRDMDVGADSLALTLMDRSGIAPGDPVTVELGFEDATGKVFTGTVAEVAVTLRGTHVLGLGAMNGLLNLRKSATYEDRSAGDIVRELIGDASLQEGTVADGPTLPRFAIDQGQSAFAHVKGLADRLGYELYADVDGNVMFQPLGPAADLDSTGGGLLGSAVATAASALGLGGGSGPFAYGGQLIALKARTGQKAVGSISVGGESPMSGEGDTTGHWLTTNDADYRGSAGSGDPSALVIDPLARTKDLADRFARGRLATSARGLRRVYFRTFGRHDLDLGDDASTAGLPDDLGSASGYVRVLRHRFGAGAGFVTEVGLSVGDGA